MADGQGHDGGGPEIPPPAFDVRKTRLWYKVRDTTSLSAAEDAILHNLEIVAAQQAKILEILSTMAISKPGTPRRSTAPSSNASRRSSMDLTGDSDDGQPGDQPTVEDVAIARLYEQENEVKKVFEKFLSDTGTRPYRNRVQACTEAAKKFIEEFPRSIPADMDEELSATLISAAQKISESSAVDLYVTLSKQLARKETARTVETRTESFRTNVHSAAGSERGSAPTEPNTPRHPRASKSKKIVPKTPAQKNGKSSKTAEEESIFVPDEGSSPDLYTSD